MPEMGKSITGDVSSPLVYFVKVAWWCSCEEGNLVRLQRWAQTHSVNLHFVFHHNLVCYVFNNMNSNIILLNAPISSYFKVFPWTSKSILAARSSLFFKDNLDFTSDVWETFSPATWDARASCRSQAQINREVCVIRGIWPWKAKSNMWIIKIRFPCWAGWGMVCWEYGNRCSPVEKPTGKQPRDEVDPGGVLKNDESSEVWDLSKKLC